MARVKKTYAEQLAAYKEKQDKLAEQIQKFKDKHSRKWFDELHDVLQKGIDDDSINIESVTPADVFNFCLQKSSPDEKRDEQAKPDDAKIDNAPKEKEIKAATANNESSKADDKKDNTSTTPAWGETAFV